MLFRGVSRHLRSLVQYCRNDPEWVISSYDMERVIVPPRRSISGVCESRRPGPARREGTVYVHWPYCKALCTYCNFNKYVGRSPKEMNKVASAILKELETSLSDSSIEEVTSLYFGGGTPSLASPDLISRTLETILNHCSWRENAQVTLEANPTEITLERLRDFQSAGVNRISVSHGTPQPLALGMSGPPF